MALRLSTGLRQDLLGSADFKTKFTASFINIYSGSQPASADSPATGTLLATIYSDGAAIGVSFDAPVAGAISKAAAQTWSGTAVATGTAGYYRLFEALDDPTLQSAVKARLDGAIATSGAELNMSSTAIVASAVQTITSFTVTLPAM